VKLCSRCRSENNGDVKFCNFCGARLRAPARFDCFEGPAPVGRSAQVVPVEVEVTDTKLAYRYFLKGKHAFAAGEIERAVLMFQCALDANPADEQVKAFLRRAAAKQRQGTAGEPEPPLQAPRTPQYGLSSVALEGAPPSRQEPVLAFEQARDLVEAAKPSVEPPLAPAAPKLRVIRPVRPAAVVAVNPEPLAIVDGPPVAPKAEPVSALPAIVPPPSPASYLDEAPDSELWKDVLASALVICGLALFGWVLIM